ncbi:MAG: hypothetical protein VXZ58_09805, partial [Actinomycetota bacterium]|nr:hypothetical protein [Actinomycetota bacterium]
MGNRIQQLWLKAERTANSDSQKQVIVNNRIKSAAQEAISIFETVEIPNTASEIKQNQKDMQRAEASVSAFSEFASPLDVDSNINVHPKGIDIKLEGLGSPQPVRSTLRKGTRSVPSKILFEARDGNSTSEQNVLSQIPDNIYSRCDQNLPEVQLGMFSNLTKSEAVMDTNSSNGYSDPTPIATKDGISTEREGSGSVRRRFLVRPGAESQEAIRKASDLCSESAYDRSTESGVSGSHTLKKIKPDTAKASNKASKDSSEDIPKRKRGRPPKKRRKGTQQQSQGHTTVHGQETIEVPQDKVAITLTTMANSLKNTNVSKTLQNSPRIAFSG